MVAFSQQVNYKNTLTVTDITKVPCFYPVFEIYGWTRDESATENFSTATVKYYIAATGYAVSTMSVTENSKRFQPTGTGNTHSTHLHIPEGATITLTLTVANGRKLNNLLINGEKYAGVDVEGENHWDEPKAAGTTLTYQFLMADDQVQDDKYLHIGAEVELTEGFAAFYKDFVETQQA